MIYSSPGVYVLERDISDVVASFSPSSAAIVGSSQKGNVDNVVLITSVQRFIDEYGLPDPFSGSYFHYSALAYLQRGSQLYCYRVHNGALYGGVNIVHADSGEENSSFTAGASDKVFSVESGLEDDVLFQVFGKDPGKWNNRIGICIRDIKAGTEEEVTDRYTFTIDIYWQDDDGNWMKVESFVVSRQKKLDGTGRQLYLEEKINGISKYIFVADNTSIADTYLPKIQSTKLQFAGGDDGSSITSAKLISGWQKFADPEAIRVKILINAGYTAVDVQSEMKNIAETRKDCIAILDVPYSSCNTVGDILVFRNNTQNFNTNYCALYAPWIKIRDAYNDVLVTVPPSGYVAGCIAYSDYIGNVWDAPAGEDRGMLNVLDVDPIVFNAGDRDILYSSGVNPIQKFQGRGIYVFGQKTLQKKNSALNRINVRRLLLLIEEDCAEVLRPFLLGPNANNSTTRFRIKALLDQYLDRLSAAGAFQTEGGDKGYLVVCDETNNTPQVIDQNELHVDIFVKPARTVEFIQLRATVTTTGASFQELISRGLLF